MYGRKKKSERVEELNLNPAAYHAAYHRHELKQRPSSIYTIAQRTVSPLLPPLYHLIIHPLCLLPFFTVSSFLFYLYWPFLRIRTTRLSITRKTTEMYIILKLFICTTRSYSHSVWFYILFRSRQTNQNVNLSTINPSVASERETFHEKLVKTYLKLSTTFTSYYKT